MNLDLKAANEYLSQENVSLYERIKLMDADNARLKRALLAVVEYLDNGCDGSDCESPKALNVAWNALQVKV